MQNAQNKSGRAVAADIVRQWLESQAFPDLNLERVTRDRAFVMEVVYGTTRWYGALEAILKHLIPSRPGPGTEAVLLTGVYQLLYMDHTEPYAVVNESVEIVKAGGGDRPAGLVNAVLRRILREETELRAFLEEQPFDVRVSHPYEMVTRWRKQYGERHVRELCAWNNLRPNVVLCVNRRRVAFAKYRAMLAQHGVKAEPHPAEPDRCLVLPHGIAVADLPGYAEGLFQIQDPSTLAPPMLLDPVPGDRVLDLCAAPGGKTSVMAEAMDGEGALVAVDLHMDRIERLTENLRRMQWDFVEVVQADATNRRSLEGALGERVGPGFDRILIDAPCSNTGVLQRRPDARWRFEEHRLKRLIYTQHALLDSAAPLLRPGGSLVYSTCSLEPEENEDLISRWLSSRTGYKRVKAKKLFPPRNGTDGGYAALIVRDPK